LFGSCIIHISSTECGNIKKIIPASKGFYGTFITQRSLTHFSLQPITR